MIVVFGDGVCIVGDLFVVFECVVNGWMGFKMLEFIEW